MKHKISFLLFVSLLNFISCNDSSNSINAPYLGPLVLLTGMESNGRHDIAKYWANGSAINLSDTSHDASAQSIYMSGNIICVVGYQSNGIHNIATCWEGGSGVTLGNSSIDSYACYVKSQVK
jgi:hypothetical protein